MRTRSYAIHCWVSQCPVSWFNLLCFRFKKRKKNEMNKNEIKCHRFVCLIPCAFFRCYCCFCIINYAVMRIQEIRVRSHLSGSIVEYTTQRFTVNAFCNAKCDTFRCSYANKFHARSSLFSLRCFCACVHILHIVYNSIVHPTNNRKRILYYI